MDEEINTISELIIKNLPKKMSGKEAVLWLKKNTNQWKQMEWGGFYFEEFLFKLLKNRIGGTKGPTFGNTTFDYKKNFIWDFKAHSEKNPLGKKIPWAVMNDKEAILKCIQNFGGVGFIMVDFSPVFDYDFSFKDWHDTLKGKKSKYVIKKDKEGVNKRIRKKEIRFTKISFIYFNSIEDILKGYNEKWLKNFQEGMKNSNDTLRRVKIQCCINKIPKEFILKEISL